MCIAVQNGYTIRFHWLENYFSDEQKQKDAEAAAHFHVKAANIAQVIII